jgi:hypothetical protein
MTWPRFPSTLRSGKGRRREDKIQTASAESLACAGPADQAGEVYAGRSRVRLQPRDFALNAENATLGMESRARVANPQATRFSPSLCLRSRPLRPILARLLESKQRFARFLAQSWRKCRNRKKISFRGAI